MRLVRCGALEPQAGPGGAVWSYRVGVHVVSSSHHLLSFPNLLRSAPPHLEPRYIKRGVAGGRSPHNPNTLGTRLSPASPKKRRTRTPRGAPAQVSRLPPHRIRGGAGRELILNKKSKSQGMLKDVLA
ncbi:hypothetical protein VPH35_082637 [Triticum aestivum]